ncbi:MAG: hypothetical protein PHP30_07190 [Bacteroidales bacterium]|nr:FKBP-type peptidyl-prolyl cis-trans isomerase [Bacteroidales bacterium]MDD2424693.1 hypothetical protein [Bacteroidales bacterium]MDD3989859.1 hypothetical protein [Bacteroidales bacterium]
MKRLYLTGLHLAVIALATLSCAREVVENADDVEKRILQAHITANYSNSVQTTASGLYIISKTSGTGVAVNDSSNLFVRYSTFNLNNDYLSTSDSSVAKILGTYKDTTYFGPVLFTLGNYSLTKGVEEALTGLKAGARVKFIEPSWLSVYNFEGSNRTSSSPVIYDIEVLRVVNDLEKFQYDSLEAFSNKYFGGLDSLSKGYYFKSIEEGVGDTLEKGEEISYRYVVRLLDGFVVDTNIEDTARKYKIYSPYNNYTARSFTVVDSLEVMTSQTLSDIPGVAKSFLLMKHGGKAHTFFSSAWGYGATQKSFGRHQPLHFYLEVVSDNDDDTDED